MNDLNLKPMLNAYPDSMGGTLADIATVLEKEELRGAFSSFYILPSLFNTDLDRGFSVIDYDLDRTLATREDLQRLQELGIDLKLDFILNHASVLSAPFQDILKKGEQSEYRDFFIDWNKFWEGHGEMTPEGYIQPDPELIKDMFFRKPGLPILMVRLPDGRDVPYWNTFYQEVRYSHVDALDLVGKTGMQYSVAKILEKRINDGLDGGKKPAEIDLTEAGDARNAVIDLLESGRKYLGQMDLNIKSPKVWEHYDNTLKTLASYGARIVRLDAFAYAPKEPGERNFLNEPGTWDLLERVRQLADKYGVTLLPEIHASYGEKTHELVASKGYMIYDFFLPGLLIDALERGNGALLAGWAQELLDKKMWAVNMLGCHDGIPMLDLKGKENTGLHPAGIVAGDTQFDGEPVHGSEGGFQAFVHQQIGVVIEQFHSGLTVEFIAADGQFRGEMMEGKELHELPHTHPEFKFFTDGFGFLSGNAGDFRQSERLPFHDQQGLVAEMLHDPGGSLGADALDDPGGEVT